MAVKKIVKKAKPQGIAIKPRKKSAAKKPALRLVEVKAKKAGAKAGIEAGKAGSVERIRTAGKAKKTGIGEESVSLQYEAQRLDKYMDAVMPIFVPMLYVPEVKELAAEGLNAGMGGKLAAKALGILGQRTGEADTPAKRDEIENAVEKYRKDGKVAMEKIGEIYSVASAWAILKGRSDDASTAARQRIEEMWKREEPEFKERGFKTRIVELCSSVNRLDSNSPDFESWLGKISLLKTKVGEGA